VGNAIPAANLKLKRSYEPAADADGTRLLVDRLWPRGISKANAALAGWLKDIAPTADLRKWFGHDPQRWPEFRRRYRAELQEHAGQLAELRRQARNGPVTLVYSAKDQTHNHAVVLRDVLLGRAEQRKREA